MLRAEAPSFLYRPDRIGSALLEGGWMVRRTMGTVNGSPEFMFPLQLVYLNTRTQRGLLGDQWFCPQLESTVLPRGRRLLLWQTLSGSTISLVPQKKNPGVFTDPGEEWRAKVKGDVVEISNADGWRFLYRAARLVSLTSPTERVLEYKYQGGVLDQVVIRDLLSNAERVLVRTVRDGKRRLESLEICGLQCRFTYDRRLDGRLLTWMPAGQSQPEKFSYEKNGVLAGIQPLSGEALQFTTQFLPPQKGKSDPELLVKPETKPANYRLVDDSVMRYSYSSKTTSSSKFQIGDGALTTAITAENRQGGKQSISLNRKLNAVTLRNLDGTSERTIYYLAPGQKHNNKIRRLERNDRIAAEYRYDKKTGLLSETQDQAGVSTFYEYGKGSQPIRIFRGTLKEKELVNAMGYDAKGRLLEKTDAEHQSTRFRYDERGDLVEITDPAGQSSVFSYDPYGRQISVQIAGQTHSVQYDEQGRPKAQVLPDGQVAEYSYDKAGKIAAIKRNGVTQTAYTRNQAGRVISKVEGNARITTYEYDSRGNVVTERKANGSVTRYEYDSLNRRTAQIDGNGNRITFAYDAAGRLIRQENPLGQKLTWRYNEKGRLVRKTNGVQTVSWTYNDHNRLKKVDYGAPGEQIVYTYDARGRIRKAATATNSITYFYDSLNRVVARQLVRGPTERVVRYGWNARNRKTSVTLSERINSPSGKGNSSEADYRLLQQTEYVYDSLGRLAELKSNGATVCRYQYDRKNHLTGRSYGNGVIATYIYDGFGRLSRLDLVGGILIEPLTLAYEWGPAGQLLSRTWNGEKQHYSYDLSGQLLSVIEGQDVKGTAPDLSAAGVDGTMEAANHDSGSSVVSSILERYQYDMAGNMLAKAERGEETVMTYDAANQLVSARTSDQTTAFAYDAAGRLHTRTIGEEVQTRHYGFLDKVLLLENPDGSRIAYDYYPDGQLAAKADLPGRTNASEDYLSKPLALLTAGGESDSGDSTSSAQSFREELVWDGLALLYHNGVSYAVEDHVSGGVPLAATQGIKTPPVYYINDILGTTLAVISADRVEIVPMTAFGKYKGSPSSERSDSESAWPSSAGETSSFKTKPLGLETEASINQ